MTPLPLRVAPFFPEWGCAADRFPVVALAMARIATRVAPFVSAPAPCGE